MGIKSPKEGCQKADSLQQFPSYTHEKKMAFSYGLMLLMAATFVLAIAL